LLRLTLALTTNRVALSLLEWVMKALRIAQTIISGRVENHSGVTRRVIIGRVNGRIVKQSLAVNHSGGFTKWFIIAA